MFSIDEYHVIRRNGECAPFNPVKIEIAIRKAFIATHGESATQAAHFNDLLSHLMTEIFQQLTKKRPHGGGIVIEDIQDQVEQALMTQGHHPVARRYVLYREERTRERQQQKSQNESAPEKILHMMDGQEKKILDEAYLRTLITQARQNLNGIDVDWLIKDVLRNVHDGVQLTQVLDCVILSARAMIEGNPDYSAFAARILLHALRTEVLGKEVMPSEAQTVYQQHFADYIAKGIHQQLLTPELQKFDLPRLAQHLVAQRDLAFDYLGIQTLYDRYFLHHQNQRIELPQWFFMRIAMGLALQEDDIHARAIEFYDVLSQFYFMSSTPTLFNASTLRPQLSSCYLTTISDDLEGIYDGLKENALLSKYAGGLGNDWTNVRALGSWIKGTNGKSQGVIPFLKVVNDTAVAVNQGGKRKGAVCAYLETWHLDIEEFLELRKNTGDDRRRCHDMNSANWIPDLFMQRVMEGGMWTLFSPSDVPDLHDLYGKAFNLRYRYYEEQALSGKITLHKRLPALDLWRKMLSMLFETGHPWITFKDPCNLRSPQQHVGVVHSSNLCTEITLNTNAQEIAVCNLGSVNLVKHLHKNADGVYVLDQVQLEKTIRTAMRMLDNVIDLNYYAVDKAKHSNLLHRPVGLGLMGFQDCLHQMDISYASAAATQFADHSTEAVCYYAYSASSDLAKERGSYSSYAGSLWQQGILPLDSIETLRQSRASHYLDVDTSSTMDWSALRAKIQDQGMRNSNCVAIAPTATISNIIGVSASIEPTYQNLYVKSNLSGEFTIINQYLVRALQKLGLWDEVMISDLKYFDGSVQKIPRIPQHIKDVYATAFEMETTPMIEAAARRQKWIDQAQSLNIYMAGASGRKLDETYKLAWLRGLKTTYYLRTMGATHAEKSTIHTGQLNAVKVSDDDGPACYLKPGDAGFDECEACQ